ncbi:MAG TPA: acyl carrier protein [Jatrophihabitans sp.]|nr:acyl carrier protein [Jatrophihabitans sp.]
MTSEEDLLYQVQQAWATVLAVESAESIPLDTNFLEIGGNSLLLVMLWEDLQEATSQILKVSDLFRHGTVRSQAALLAGAGTPVPEPAPVGASARSQLLGRARRTELATGDGSAG